MFVFQLHYPARLSVIMNPNLTLPPLLWTRFILEVFARKITGAGGNQGSKEDTAPLRADQLTSACLQSSHFCIQFMSSWPQMNLIPYLSDNPIVGESTQEVPALGGTVHSALHSYVHTNYK